MSFVRCFSSLGCPESSLEDTLALAQRHGLPAVELRSLSGTVELPRLFQETFGAPAKLAEHLRGSPVRIVALDGSLRLTAATPAEREQLLALAPWADAIGARWLRVFDGNDADGAALATAADTVKWWREQRRAHGWTCEIMVETHDSLVTASAIERFAVGVPGVAILWDSHHTWRKGGEDPVATWRAVRSRVVHVHVKDSDPVPSARHPYTYRLPGDGGFPIAPLLDALRADKFAGAVSLEWEKLWHPYLPSLDEALATAAARKWW